MFRLIYSNSVKTINKYSGRSFVSCVKEVTALRLLKALRIENGTLPKKVSVWMEW